MSECIDRVVRLTRLSEPRLAAAVDGEALYSTSSDASPFAQENSREPRPVDGLGTCKVCRCCNRITPGCCSVEVELAGAGLGEG